MNKKGVSDVVATILIILLVLAAVIIVWQVVSKVVKGGAVIIEERSKCIDVSLDFVANSITCNISSTTVTGSISRSGDDVENLKMKVVVGGNVSSTLDAPVSLGTKTFSQNGGANGVLVKVAPVIIGTSGEITCDPTAEFTLSTCTA